QPLWVSSVVTRTFPILPVRPDTAMFDETVAIDVGIVTSVGLVTLAVVFVGAAGRVVTASDQLPSTPPLVAVSSETRSVHTPFGFSPSKAANASSGTRF